ncbi:MAG: hypothetical protein HC912_09645 [Saprospiraceae bacterium]|nr:hypothetical protein [Saprospiraceae bacterium]
MPRIIAKILTILFHPLLIATYMLVFLLLLNPYLFGVGNISSQLSLIMILFFSTFFMPMVMVLMLKQLDFISSLKLEKREERIAPFIFAGFFYVSMTVFLLLPSSRCTTCFFCFSTRCHHRSFCQFSAQSFHPN